MTSVNSEASLAVSGSDVQVRSRKQLNKSGIDCDKMVLKLSEDQRNCAEEAFKSFDSNENGLVSISNLRPLLRLLGFNPTEEEIETVINEYQIDGISEMDLQEFLAMLSPMMVQDDVENELLEMIHVLDPGRKFVLYFSNSS